MMMACRILAISIAKIHLERMIVRQDSVTFDVAVPFPHEHCSANVEIYEQNNGQTHGHKNNQHDRASKVNRPASLSHSFSPESLALYSLLLDPLAAE